MAQRTCACRGRFDLRARVSSPPFRASGCEGVPKSRARVARNVRLADMNIDVPISDDRRTEVVANALSLRHSAQQAVDATIVSRVTRAGEAQPVADVDPGRAVDGAARRKRHQSYPERLVVIGVEVGGRSGAEAATWLRLLAGQHVGCMVVRAARSRSKARHRRVLAGAPTRWRGQRHRRSARAA